MANQHVIKRGPDWGVRKEGASRDTKKFGTQAKAKHAARKIAKKQGGDVITHDRQGKIDHRNTYSKKDPYPPKG